MRFPGREVPPARRHRPSYRRHTHRCLVRHLSQLRATSGSGSARDQPRYCRGSRALFCRCAYTWVSFLVGPPRGGVVCAATQGGRLAHTPEHLGHTRVRGCPLGDQHAQGWGTGEMGRKVHWHTSPGEVIAHVGAPGNVNRLDDTLPILDQHVVGPLSMLKSQQIHTFPFSPSHDGEGDTVPPSGASGGSVILCPLLVPRVLRCVRDTRPIFRSHWRSGT